MYNLAENPDNFFKDVRCPVCGSANWYRNKDGTFVCKKCMERWQLEESKFRRIKTLRRPRKPLMRLSGYMEGAT